MSAFDSKRILRETRQNKKNSELYLFTGFLLNSIVKRVRAFVIPYMIISANCR